jgi:hypothetical protein
MIVRVMRLVIGVIAVGVLVSGCGGGGSSSSAGQSTSNAGAESSTEAGATTGPQKGGGAGAPAKSETTLLSKAQFVQRASALCRRLTKRKLAKTEAYLEEQSAQGVSRPVLLADAAKAVLMPIVEARIAGIRKLGVPAGDEAEVEAMLAGQEEGIEQVKALKKFVEGESLLPYFAESNKLFESYGLSACEYDL